MKPFIFITLLSLLFFLVGFLIYLGAFRRVEASARVSGVNAGRVWWWLALVDVVLLSLNHLYLLWRLAETEPHDAGEELVLLISLAVYGVTQIILTIAVVGFWVPFQPRFWVAGSALGGAFIFNLILVCVNGMDLVIRPISAQPGLLLDARVWLQLGGIALGPKVPFWPLVFSGSCLEFLARLHVQERGKRQVLGVRAEPEAAGPPPAASPSTPGPEEHVRE
jgi:hypothetical protein